MCGWGPGADRDEASFFGQPSLGVDFGDKGYRCVVQSVVGSDIGGLPLFERPRRSLPKERRLAMINSVFAQHMRNNTVLFVPCVVRLRPCR